MCQYLQTKIKIRIKRDTIFNRKKKTQQTRLTNYKKKKIYSVKNQNTPASISLHNRTLRIQTRKDLRIMPNSWMEICNPDHANHYVSLYLKTWNNLDHFVDSLPYIKYVTISMINNCESCWTEKILN